jgi:hypothetical protein
MNQTAATIFHQLGANKFRAMTGARNFTHGAPETPYLAFAFPRAKGPKGSVNRCCIRYEAGLDLYTMEFSYFHGSKFTMKATVEQVYADQLQAIFTEQTGLYTSL